VEQVLAIPRIASYCLEELPRNLEYDISAIGSKFKYLLACMRVALLGGHYDLIVCSHLHLLPIAYLVKWFKKCPVLPVIYGVEAWNPTSHWIANRLCRKLDAFISIRDFTARRFIQWAELDHARVHLLPNCIDESQFGLAPKRPDLLERYGLEGKSVVMTAGRLDEKRKGFDEVLEVLPGLKEQIPNLAYVIMGDGDDGERLSKKTEELGISDLVVFTGYVANEEKADHYRLADVFAMPGSAELFDSYPYRFVFLEALACGVPVVGCRLKDESEANDPFAQKLIIQVDPGSKHEIMQGILKAFPLSGRVPPELSNFYFPSFLRKVHRIIDGLPNGTGQKE